MEENAARMLVRCARHLNHDKGKRPAQERILYLLRKNEKMTQKELQDAMQIRQGSMSEIMQKLESHGLIEKSRNPEDAMTQLMKGRTSLIIAHRLSTIRDADMIIVMDHCEISEQGPHDELI